MISVLNEMRQQAPGTAEMQQDKSPPHCSKTLSPSKDGDDAAGARPSV